MMKRYAQENGVYLVAFRGGVGYVYNCYDMGAPQRKHDFQQARFTGNMCCAVCGLVPLDSDDTETPCPGKRIED